jgi:hypothetical protein
MSVEELSMELVNNVLSNPDLPKDKIKNLKLRWVEVYGELLPDLDITFYETYEQIKE